MLLKEKNNSLLKSNFKKQVKMNFGPPPKVNRNLPIIADGYDHLHYRIKNRYNSDGENYDENDININNLNRNIRIIHGYDYVSPLTKPTDDW